MIAFVRAKESTVCTALPRQVAFQQLRSGWSLARYLFPELLVILSPCLRPRLSVETEGVTNNQYSLINGCVCTYPEPQLGPCSWPPAASSTIFHLSFQFFAPPERAPVTHGPLGLPNGSSSANTAGRRKRTFRDHSERGTKVDTLLDPHLDFSLSSQRHASFVRRLWPLAFQPSRLDGTNPTRPRPHSLPYQPCWAQPSLAPNSRRSFPRSPVPMSSNRIPLLRT